MSQVLALEKPPYLSALQHPFLQELINQIRLADTLSKYCDWSDELLVNQLITSAHKTSGSSTNLNLECLNHLVTSAFYNAIGAIIQRKTGHPTETYINLQGKECNSAVICCGGVLVMYSLIWGYQHLSFLSLQRLIESAENNIHNAINKASRYLDF